MKLILIYKQESPKEFVYRHHRRRRWTRPHIIKPTVLDGALLQPNRRNFLGFRWLLNSSIAAFILACQSVLTWWPWTNLSFYLNASRIKTHGKELTEAGLIWSPSKNKLFNEIWVFTWGCEQTSFIPCWINSPLFSFYTLIECLCFIESADEW